MKTNRRHVWLALILCCAFVMSAGMYTAYADDDDWDEADTDTAKSQQNDKVDSDTPAADTAPETTTTDSGNGKYQSEIDDINSKIKNLNAEKEKLKEEINNAKTVKEQEVAAKNSLDYEITLTKDEIALLEERIRLLEESIEEKEQEIEDKQAEYDEKYELFLQRLRVMYMYDDATTLGLIMGADNFVDFLTKSETVVRIAAHDRDLMQTLNEERLGLEEDQRELEEAKADVEEDKIQTEQVKDELASKVSAISLKIQDLDEMERQFQADLAKNQAMTKAMEAELAEIYRKIEWDKNPYVGGVMQWPVNGYYKITSDYGWRFGGSDYHTGIDISGTGVYGAPITAANAGTVKVANWSYTNGRGYGIYVILDHGGTVSTLYGHMSNISVKVGQTVKKGEQIGNVGSTGWSTGPHLHFEVRENGNHKDPKPYVKG